MRKSGSEIKLVLNMFLTIIALSMKELSSFADLMLSNEKIYVVLAVVLIIWFGIIFFLFRTDKKIDALEKKMNTSMFEQDQKK